MSNFNENKVNRQASGTSAGGQFANKDHPANDEVGLGNTEESRVDQILSDIDNLTPAELDRVHSAIEARALTQLAQTSQPKPLEWDEDDGPRPTVTTDFNEYDGPSAIVTYGPNPGDQVVATYEGDEARLAWGTYFDENAPEDMDWNHAEAVSDFAQEAALRARVLINSASNRVSDQHFELLDNLVANGVKQ